MEASRKHTSTMQNLIFNTANKYHSWAAIVRGAALYGLTGQSLVQSRAIRDSFALLCDEDWDEDVHNERDQTFDRINNKYIARDQLKWFVNKVRHITILCQES